MTVANCIVCSSKKERLLQNPNQRLNPPDLSMHRTFEMQDHFWLASVDSRVLELSEGLMKRLAVLS